MRQYHFQLSGIATLACLLANFLVPAEVNAQVPLLRADVEAIQNRVELLPKEGSTRLARLSDWLSLGDAVRTAEASRVDLRFNDGSLARVGERATFWFVPNTRNFRLSNGTALFLIPPNQGPSTIETPNAVTGIQGTALIVRHIPGANVSSGSNPITTVSGQSASLGRTVVMVLTNNPAGPVEVSLPDGRGVDLMAGEMAIINHGELLVFEFDLELFYETSPLVEDLHLDNPNYPDTGLPTDPVRQETLDGLFQQQNFEGEHLLNPAFLNSESGFTEEASIFYEPATREIATPDSPYVQNSPSSDQSTLDNAPVGLDIAIPSGSEVLENANSLPPGLLNPESDDPPTQDDPTTVSPSGSPANPGTPVNDSGSPVVPATPATPADPGVPGTPATPAIPATPASPSEN